MTCEGKERFLTFALAEMVSRKRRRQGTKRAPYKCGECGSYHVGSVLDSIASRRRPRLEFEPEAA